MKCSFRGLTTFLGGAVFIAFACFTGPNCQPAGGDLGNGGSEQGGSGSSGQGGSGGSGQGGSGQGGSGEGGSGNGGSKSNGGSGGGDATGGKTSSGGSGSGGKTGNGGSGGSSNGGSSATSSGGSSNGGTTSAGGATTTPVGGVGGSTSGGTTSGALKCAPTTATTPAITSTGGFACPGGLCTVGTYAGYMYVYSDGTSKVCAAAESLCASGSTGAADAKGTIWGSGVGFNLDKSTTPVAVQLAGTGITYALSAMPSQGMRAQVSVAGTDYCVKLATASGTVLWTDFNTACWDNSGTKLTAAPSTAHIGFQVTAATAAGNFDFCVTKVSF